MVDGKEIAEFAGLWAIKEDRTQPRVLEWTTSPASDILEAEHFGYNPIVHRRRVELTKATSSVLITDHVRGTGKHLVESFLHFAPHVRLEQKGSQTILATGTFGSYRFEVSSGKLEIQDTWFSKSYGVRERNKMLYISWQQELPLETTIRIEHA